MSKPNIVHLKDFPLYKISREGIVFGQNGKPLKARPNIPSRKGNLSYLMVALYDGRGMSGRKDRYIHRLVLEAFVGPCPEGMEARHINGDHQDNRLENLCWGTKEENMKDRVLHNPNCKKCNKPLEGKNLMMVSNGKIRVRKCRACHNKRTLKALHDKKEVARR